MSLATAYQYPLFDLFGYSSKSSLREVNDMVDKETRHWDRLATEQKRLEDIDATLKLPQRYRERNWDGCDASPIPDAAVQEARVFLRKLPPTLPLPEVIAEPDGYIGLEWYVNKWLLYVVSFNGKGIISCSGLIGQRRTYAPMYMDDSIPAEILREITRVLS